LNPEPIDKLELTLGKSECLRIAYEMKEKFRKIYETNFTVKKGQKKIIEWLNHAQVFLRESDQQLRIILRVFATTFLLAPQVESWKESTIGLS
jgi:hypothetical protein